MGGNSNAFYIMSDIDDEYASYILNFYENHEIPQEILMSTNENVSVLEDLLKVPVIVPQKGKKNDLVNLAIQNAKIVIENEYNSLIINEKKTYNANRDLAKILNLENIHRIDAFDNSNLFGSFSVSGMVVFINGLPAKKEYRKYKISAEKNDDFHMMQEVIYRRYYRALVEKEETPDLILVDGGINQINACKEILNELNLNIKVCGLKKDDKHRTSELVDGDSYVSYAYSR